MAQANGFTAVDDLQPLDIQEDNIAPFSLPQEALTFVPDDLALISQFAGGDQERKIHCNLELRPDEFEQVKALQEEAKRLGRAYYTSITVMATRYISYARGNAPKAIAMMDETQAWRTEYFGKGPLSDAQLIDDLSHGILYFTGRDNALRPILVIRAERLPAAWHKDGTGVTRLIKMLVFCMEYLRRYMFIPGKVENLVVLCDLKNLGITDVPLKALKNIYSVLSHHYIVRVFRFYIVNMSYMLGTLVSLVKPILTDRQRQKLNFLKSTSECKDFCALHHLEDDLGGTRPKLTKFFPFPLLPGPFGLGSTASPTVNAVPNCHKALTLEGFRGRVWDTTLDNAVNSQYEYTEFAEDIFNQCGIPIPPNCPVKPTEPEPVKEEPKEAIGDTSGGRLGPGKGKFIVSLDDPILPWEKVDSAPQEAKEAPKEAEVGGLASMTVEVGDTPQEIKNEQASAPSAETGKKDEKAAQKGCCAVM